VTDSRQTTDKQTDRLRYGEMRRNRRNRLQLLRCQVIFITCCCVGVFGGGFLHAVRLGIPLKHLVQFTAAAELFSVVR